MPTTHDKTASITNAAAYKFALLDRLVQRRQDLRTLCRELKLKGTILLSEEGVNLFVAGRRPQVEALLESLRQEPVLANLEAKFSPSDRQPFSRMLVKIKREIIAFGVPTVRPDTYTSRKMPADELKRLIEDGQPPVLLDVRNTYETQLGTFAGAITLPIDHFRQFPRAAAALPEPLKQRPLVMFCTGGIRCEKAGPYLEQLGFQNVYQLEGGILKYFELCQGTHYDGECFVFDQRVSVDHALQETATVQCYPCQHPLTPADQQAETYQPGVSCPYCYQPPDAVAARAMAQRRQQIEAATRPLPGSAPYTNRRPIFVTAKDHNRRLLDVVSQKFSFTSRDAWQERIEGGFLMRHGQSLRTSDLVRAGDRLEHIFPATTEPDVNANIELIYEDESIVAVSKPAPLPMHPCGRFNRNSLIWILDAVYHPQKLRPAHRLDANTTGVVILSRTRETASKLQPRFEQGEIHKTYLARIIGHPPHDEFVCEAGISTHSLEAGARTIDPAGLEACTEFHVHERRDDGTALVRVHPVTGRTNQIRLHLWHLGWPIQGDPTYLPGRRIAKKQTLTVNDDPLCLHAWQIEFDHPIHEQAMTLVAPLPHWASVHQL